MGVYAGSVNGPVIFLDSSTIETQDNDLGQYGFLAR
jgi:hypothetical protein